MEIWRVLAIGDDHVSQRVQTEIFYRESNPDPNAMRQQAHCQPLSLSI